MALHGRLEARLTETLTLSSYAGSGFRNEPTYSTVSTTHPCRVEFRQHTVKDVQGNDLLARGVAMIGPSSTGKVPFLNQDDRVTLSTRHRDRTPRLLFIEQSTGLKLGTVTKVHFG